MYFADKWYDLRQDKHHRWKLDRRQVQQYGIGGVLASDRSWWEGVPIPPRKLSILAPTGWLALCPLICEDLAQLEPVSELIRGVGPTLLVALLLDGPQLPSRWSARYASVMADDPGTSVLTVTSLGMASRSKPARSASGHTPAVNEPVTVALWRDAQTGFQELQLAPGDDALIATLSAGWREESSLDGRSDGGSAATFVLNGVQGIKAPAVTDFNTPLQRTHMMRGDQEDLYELTTFTQLVDACLDSSPASVASVISLARGETDSGGTPFPAEIAAAVDLILESQGRWRTTTVASEEYSAAVNYFEQLCGRFPPPIAPPAEAAPGRGAADVAKRVSRLGTIERIVSDDLARVSDSDSRVERRRTNLAVLHNVLWAVHNRLEQMRRNGSLTMDGAQLAIRIQQNLAKPWTFEPYTEEAAGFGSTAGV